MEVSLKNNELTIKTENNIQIIQEIPIDKKEIKKDDKKLSNLRDEMRDEFCKMEKHLEEQIKKSESKIIKNGYFESKFNILENKINSMNVVELLENAEKAESKFNRVLNDIKSREIHREEVINSLCQKVEVLYTLINNSSKEK